MRESLFKNASLRLTAIYLLIVMVISLLFSVNAYRSYMNEINRSVRRPLPAVVQRLSRENIQTIIDEREDVADAAIARYRTNLILLNLLILVAGGAVSYGLARRTLQPIEESHEALERFTADASHELRTPITAMRVENEITLSDPKLTLKDAKLQLESNIEELDKLTSLSEGLLTLARLDEGDLHMHMLDIADALNQAVNRVKPLAEAKKQLIKANITPQQVTGNMASLTEAVVILLDNAVKYSPKKSEIKIANSLQSQEVNISVSDEGPGITKQDLPHIFDRFYRADPSRTKNNVSGHGIGLSLATSIVEAHNGSISVKNRKKGAIFTIKLPLS